MRGLRRSRRRHMIPMTLVALAALFVVMFVSPTTLAYATFTQTKADWGPCNGYDNYNLNTAELTNSALFDGYGSNFANSNICANPDTTEHDILAGVYDPVSFSPKTTGTLTITVSFSGTVAAYGYAQSGGCGEGNAFFTIYAGATNVRTGSSVSAPRLVATYTGHGCNTGGYQLVNMNPYTVSYTGTFVSGQTYDPFGEIEAQNGASQPWGGGHANAIVAFNDVCYSQGFTTSTVQLNSWTVS